MIRRKYGEERGGWRSGETRKAYGVGLWKAVNKVGQLVTPFFGFEVGDGKNVSFWKDKWCEINPLCEAFPSLFAIATSKETWVNEVWTAEGERRGSWTPTFNRLFNDWEMEEVGRLLCCLDGKKVRADEEDRVRWVGSKDGVFSVKSLYRALQPVSSASFPSKIIWMSYAQPKISFFAWEASWGRVLILDRLQKRGWALTNRCFLCQMCGELIDHLLLHCEKTREVWMLLLSFYGVSWVFPYLVKETFVGWRGSFVGKKRKVVWQLEPLFLFWVFWKARNTMAFEDCVLSIQRLKASFVYLLWSETNLWIKDGSSTLIDFIDWVCLR